MILLFLIVTFACILNIFPHLYIIELFLSYPSTVGMRIPLKWKPYFSAFKGLPEGLCMRHSVRRADV